MNLTEALELVCDIADEWAGEYGFAMPQYATEVYKASDLVREEFGLNDDKGDTP